MDFPTTEPLAFPRIGVATFVLRGADVLLGRSKKEPIVGKWVIPGGRVKPFERLQETAVREFLEETGITITAKNVLFVSENVQPPNDHRIVIYVDGQYVSGEPTPGDDLSEVRWVDVRQLGELQSDMTDMTLDALYKFSLVLRARTGR